jgi:NTP pyrophosphatase (non-canonical NTP hydrolase)
MSQPVTLYTLQQAVVAFAQERDWEQFHDAKNLSMALASEVGELSAVLRWTHSDQVDVAMAEPVTREALHNEIGDVGILLLLLCARTGVDLGDAVVKKLDANARKYPLGESRGLAEPPGGHRTST